MFQGLNRSRRARREHDIKRGWVPCLLDPDKNSGTKQPHWPGYFTTNKPQTTIVPTVTRQDTTFKIRSCPLVFATSCVSDLAITTASPGSRPGVDQNSRRPKGWWWKSWGRGQQLVFKHFASVHPIVQDVASQDQAYRRPDPGKTQQTDLADSGESTRAISKARSRGLHDRPYG